MRKGDGAWLLRSSGSASFLLSQCDGRSGIEELLSDGWIIRFCWEDTDDIVFIMERSY